MFLKKGLLVTGIIIIIIGIFIFLFFDESRSLEYYNYYFEVEIDPLRIDLSSNPQLQDFQIYYDFYNYKGSISFYVAGTNTIRNIILRIPIELELKDINWNSKYYSEDEDYSKYKEQIDYKIEMREFSYLRDYNYSNIILTRLNDNFEDRTFVNISFNGKLYPNAQFEFVPTSKIQVRKGDERGALFKFNLGNKYSCMYEPCYELIEEELQFIKGDNKIAIAIKPTSSNWNDGVDHTRFNLYYNKKDSKYSKWISYLKQAIWDILIGIILGYFLTRAFDNLIKPRIPAKHTIKSVDF